MLHVVRSVATAWTRKPASGVMIEERAAVFGRKATARPELFEMLVAPDKWNRQLFEQQERNGLSAR